jgi:RNA:NAD 2'-phosphotransferase (TPT1/KptA family)
MMEAIVGYDRDIPEEIPTGMTDFEWQVIRIVLGLLRPAEATEFATLAMGMQPILQASQNSFTRCSSALSGMLRHVVTTKQGHRCDQGGWWYLDDLIRADMLSNMRTRSGSITAAQFVCLVIYNDKGRFEFKVEASTVEEMERHANFQRLLEGPAAAERPRPAVLLRATQGHSIPLDPFRLYKTVIKLSEVDHLSPVIHGTYGRYLSSIAEQGLLPGGLRRRGRRAVHFMAQGLKRSGEVRLSCVRRDADLFYYLDLEKWITDGKSAFLSANGVVNIFEPVAPEQLRANCQWR